MQILFTILLSLFFSRTGAAASNATPALFGKWELTTVDCADHKLGAIAEMSRKAIATKAVAETLDISAQNTLSIALERVPPIQPDKYCETILQSGWQVKGDIITVSGDKLKSRQGRGGYQCRGNLDDKSILKQTYQLKFKVIGDNLQIINKDISIMGADKKLAHLCQSGANYVRTYRRVKK